MVRQISKISRDELRRMASENRESTEHYLSRIGARKKRTQDQEYMDELLDF